MLCSYRQASKNASSQDGSITRPAAHFLQIPETDGRFQSQRNAAVITGPQATLFRIAKGWRVNWS
jgi:hypothetical protein